MAVIEQGVRSRRNPPERNQQSAAVGKMNPSAALPVSRLIKRDGHIVPGPL